MTVYRLWDGRNEDRKQRFRPATYKMRFYCQTSPRLQVSFVVTHKTTRDQAPRGPSRPNCKSNKVRATNGDGMWTAGSKRAGKHTLKVRGVSFRKLLRRSVRGRDTCPWTLTHTAVSGYENSGEGWNFGKCRLPLIFMFWKQRPVSSTASSRMDSIDKHLSCSQFSNKRVDGAETTG